MEKSHFQIKSERIFDVKFALNKSFKFSKEGIPLDIAFKTNIEKISENEANVMLYLKIFHEEISQTDPFYIGIGVEGIFVWDSECKDVDKLLKINAPSVLMSNLRSIISQLTVYAGVPPLILPLIDFTKNPDNETIKS